MELQTDCILAPLLAHIINTYYVNLYSVLILHDSQSGSLYNEFECSVTNALIFRNAAPSNNALAFHYVQLPEDITDGFVQDIFISNIELGLQGYIVYSNNIERFLSLKYDVQQISKQRIRDLIFLFICEEHTMADILFQNPAFQLYPNHLVVIPTDESHTTFTLWSQQFNGIAEQNSMALLADIFYSNGTFERNAPLYWDKTWNLMGRKMTVATVTYLPYSITEYVAAGTGSVNEFNSTEEKTVMYEGTEARLVMEFCRLRNCTLEILPFPGDYWGGIENGTGDGQIGAVYDHQVEFAIGCIYKWYSDVFDMTQSVAKSAVTLLVPEALPLSYALTPILPFAPSTWLFLFITINISVALYYAVKMFSELLSFKDTVERLSDVDRSTFRTSFRSTYLEVVAVFLQQSFGYRSADLSVRTVYCVLLISGITLENSYSGGLKALLTVPRFHEKISTVHEFVETGYHWGAPQPAWAYSIVHAQVPDDLAMYRRFEAHNNEVLHNKSFSRQYGIAIERLHAGSYSFNDYVQMDSLPMKDMLREDVYYDYSNGYAIRGWPLMPYFDKLAMEITQHGLLNRWETVIVNHYLNFTIENYLRQLSLGYKDPAGPEVLRIAHISGPMAMLAVGVIVALLAFIAEHTAHRMFSRRRTGI